MTKLTQWISIIVVLFAVWVALLTDVTPIKLAEAGREVVLAMPIYLLMVFACYSLAVVGYRVATFNDCEQAAEELKMQIKEAKADLRSRGLDIS